jgi:hypothetical protein
VLFVVGSGRSGSTLLGRMIGVVPGFVHVGELTLLWDRGLRENQLCGCGTPFHECPFWRSVIREAFGTAGLSRGRIDELCSARQRADYAPRAVFGDASSHRSGYAASLGAVVRAVRDVSGADVVVDSSKRPAHGLVLASADGIRLQCIHLVRDSRAVCYSTMRTRLRPEIHWTTAYMPTGRPWRQASRWCVRNLLAQAVRRSSTASTRARYEDVAAEPRGELRRIIEAVYGATPQRADWFDREAAGSPGCHVVDLPVEHSVSGNPMRFETGPVVVRVDDEWRTSMRAADRFVVTAISAPLLRRYGYGSRRPVDW